MSRDEIKMDSLAAHVKATRRLTTDETLLIFHVDMRRAVYENPHAGGRRSRLTLLMLITRLHPLFDVKDFRERPMR